MADVIFIDTSVLLCILDIPGKNQERVPVLKEFKALATTGGHTLILPVATIIETGNHIAQLSDGQQRRERMEALCRLLLKSAMATAPWVVGNANWDRVFIENLVNGISKISIESLTDLASRKVGIGDASIIHETAAYRASTNTPSGQRVKIWTLDAGLMASI